MSLRLFTDIDDTWMSTSRKVTPDRRATIGATKPDGRPGSFMSPVQAELYRILSAAADSRIPVTARSPESLHRVRLDFTGGAIVDFGATLLDAEGQIDEGWRAQMLALAEAQETARVLDELQGRVLAHKFGVKPEQRATAGVPAFVNFRGDPGGAGRVRVVVEAELYEMGQRAAVYLHVTDRDVAVLPKFITKGHAVRHLVEQRGWSEDLLLGCGDSLSDCSFLADMSFALLPKNTRALSTLVQAAWSNGELA